MKRDHRSRLRWILGVLILTGAVGTTHAADHRDAPLIIGNVQQDINDIYAFQSPENDQNVVLIMTVNPFIGMFAQDGTLDPNTIYEFLVDINGDARDDINFAFRFSRPNGLGQQSFLLQTGRTTLARGVTGQTTPVRGGGKVLISIQDDPFFFDPAALSGGMGGNDAFAGADITAITLEIPRRNLRANNVGVWGITEVRGRQSDRMGRPAINTVLIPTANKDAFNQAQPINDVRDFTQDVVDSITGLGNGAQAETLAGILLPDILTVDTSSTDGFLNGRKLADDVIDAELNILTNGGLTSDGVDKNDLDFSNTFPYLAPPHNP